jgi:hypothetical protein
MSLPNVEDVRQRISQVNNETIRHTLMACYLFAGRISEVIGRASPKDTTTARGPKGTDVRLEKYRNANLEADVAIFTIQTAKRQGRQRLIALPLNEDYEPWSKVLYDYFQKTGSSLVFPFTRQRVSKYIVENKIFSNLTYPIERYVLTNEQTLEKVEVKMHNKPFRLHALRHLRASELVEYYGFDAFLLAAYGGWTIKGMVGGAGAFDRYVSLSWQSYFPKLLREREKRQNLLSPPMVRN